MFIGWLMPDGGERMQPVVRVVNEDGGGCKCLGLETVLATAATRGGDGDADEGALKHKSRR